MTIANALANVLNLGDGPNVVNGAATGNNVVTGGAGADSFITATIGNNVVNFGNGANAFTATSGNNTYTGGTGVDTVSVGAGMNVLTLGTGADAVTFSALTANANTYTTIVDAHATMTLNLTALDADWRDLAAFSKVAALAPTAVFQDYLNAASVGNGTTALTSGIALVSSDQRLADAGGAIVRYFNYAGDTYIVVDNSASSSFVNGADVAIKLTGTVDLSTATHATSIITLV